MWAQTLDNALDVSGLARLSWQLSAHVGGLFREPDHPVANMTRSDTVSKMLRVAVDPVLQSVSCVATLDDGPVAP